MYPWLRNFMSHRANEWIQRLLAPLCVIVAVILVQLGVGLWRTVATILSLFCALVLVTIVVDPGPKTKGFVEVLRSRFG